MKKKKHISEEQHYLCEIGLEKMPYGSSWLFKYYTAESLTHITITAYYNVDEAFLQTPTAAWGNLWDCRAALRKLVSSVYLESDLNLPFGKNGKFLFQLGYTPVVSDMKKIVQKTAASSFPTWTLAVWDMGTATLYMVKYDRSHWFFFCLSVIPFVTRPTALLSSLMVETPALKETFRKTQRGDHFWNVELFLSAPLHYFAVRFWQWAALKKPLSPSFSKSNTPI